MFIYTLITGYSYIIIYYNYFAYPDSNNFSENIYFGITNNYIRPVLILLLPIIGIFINKKIGWILIQSYFYFLISNLVFSARFMELTDNPSIYILIVIFIILLLILIVMNKTKISSRIYGIGKTQLLKMNIIACTIGISITILSVILKGNVI